MLHKVDENPTNLPEGIFRLIVEAAPNAIVATAPSGEILLVNAQAEHLFGYPRQEMLGQSVEMLVPQRFRTEHPHFRAKFFHTPMRRAMGAGRELYARRKDGTEFPVEIGLTPVETPEGLLVLSAIVDITLRKRAEESLREFNATLEKQVAERTAVAVHRAAQLQALAGELTQVEQSERRRLAQILHDHIQQLLAAARMRLGSLASHLADAALRQEMQKVEELLSQAINDARSLAIELSPPVLHDAGLQAALHWLSRRMSEQHNLAVEIADPEQIADRLDENLRILVFNGIRELLFNVVKHARVDQARVRVAAGPSGYVQFAVEDDGIGFDASVQSWQAMATEHFGLFGIRERLGLLGGRLEIASTPGQGTRAVIVAPIRRIQPIVVTKPMAPIPLLTPAQGASLRSPGAIRVLIADDHKIVREGLASLLACQPGIEVVGQAADGQEALEMAHLMTPDVVAMDISMPRMDGIEATRRITAEVPGVNVVGISMHEAQDLADAMRRAGAKAYISKDSPADILVAAIRTAHCPHSPAAV